MRDPARIPRMLDLLRQVWERHPDLRLGQIVVDATTPGVPVFYVEDDLMEAALRKMAPPRSQMGGDSAGATD